MNFEYLTTYLVHGVKSFDLPLIFYIVSWSHMPVLINRSFNFRGLLMH